MKPAASKSTGRWIYSVWLGVSLCLAAGCAALGHHLDEAVQADRRESFFSDALAEGYRPRCPDILQVTIAGQPECSGQRAIGVDGRINLGNGEQPRVENLSLPMISRKVAESAGVDCAQVQIELTEYRSQQIYLLGPAAGSERAVPYRGRETVLDLLQRTGAITPGSAPNEIYVIRSHVTEGRPPELFTVDLRAILRHDEQTNLPLLAFDQVYIGENQSSRLEHCIPPCLRPLYERCCGLRRNP
jgi:protein involved in polysaccharide export with SLBB domain